MSILEGVLSRGDRALKPGDIDAYNRGCRFDAWSADFSYEKWRLAFQESGVDPDRYLRQIPEESNIKYHLAHFLKIPGIVDVHLPESGGSYAWCWISINKKYPGHAQQVRLLEEGPSLGKRIGDRCGRFGIVRSLVVEGSSGAVPAPPILYPSRSRLQ
jgi:hypothetical protein